MPSYSKSYCVIIVDIGVSILKGQDAIRFAASLGTMAAICKAVKLYFRSRGVENLTRVHSGLAAMLAAGGILLGTAWFDCFLTQTGAISFAAMLTAGDILLGMLLLRAVVS